MTMRLPAQIKAMVAPMLRRCEIKSHKCSPRNAIGWDHNHNHDNFNQDYLRATEKSTEAKRSGFRLCPESVVSHGNTDGRTECGSANIDTSTSKTTFSAEIVITSEPHRWETMAPFFISTI